MYPWKCWRDTRRLFMTFLLALMIFPSLFTVSFHASHARAGTATGTIVRGESPERIQSAAESSWNSLVGFGLFFIVLAATSLGSNGVGDDFRQGTLEFLLTRPRSRAYFVWCSWGVGIAELVALLAGAVAVRYILLLYVTGTPWTWRLAGAVPLLWCVGSFSYGLTYLATMIARNGRIGISCGLLAIVGYAFVSVFVRYVWKIELPSPASGIGEWFSHPTGWFLVGKVLVWTLVAILFPLASQILLERAEC
jgi:ABC-type transport system involved in multi-copper enzyme maturation permease subunit